MSGPHSAAPCFVSVIVPARDEEACLAACLQSLVAQAGVNYEIIVVDDHSTDRTAEIARSFPAVKCMSAPPLPGGWMGKNNALYAGAQASAGKWLLFTDADTVHLPGSLARALKEVQQRGASLLSFSPRQDVGGSLEKAVMAVIFAELAATYRPSKVNDPESPAAANGQYLLILRDAYEAIGGHRAIASDLLEDVALATLVKRSGRKIVFRYGGDAVRTRMYRNFSELREGWTKNLAVLFPNPLRLALRRSLEFFVITAAAAICVRELLAGNGVVASITALVSAAAYLRFLQRIRNAHFPWDANLLAIVGLPVFSYLLVRSNLHYAKGSVTWKGRSYRVAPAISETKAVGGKALQGQTWCT